MLGPALVASASGSLAFVAIHGTAPLLGVTGSPSISLKDLAAALGLLAGIGASLFASRLRTAKHLTQSVRACRCDRRVNAALHNGRVDPAQPNFGSSD